MAKTLFLLAFLMTSISLFPQSFKTEQLKYERVRTAYKDKEKEITALLKSKSLEVGKIEIYFRAFKDEGDFEVWAKSKSDQTFQLLKTYKICRASGDLGPKRKQGDLQVPEGFYSIHIFNPNSNYYLSLGVNYPNASDKKLSDKTAPGGDIFIHGKCVTIGCLPLTDSKIKEVYLLAVEAKNAGQKQIRVDIFPFRMTESNLTSFSKSYSQHANFWKNLKQGYDLFEKSKTTPKVSVDAKGKYLFN